MKTERFAQMRRYRRRKNVSKAIILALTLMLLVGGIIGGTVAWLTAQTKEVKNVFTASDINITLTETEREYKMIPGWTVEKDPVVTVEGGSEDCWLFIKVEKSENLDDYIIWDIDPNNWKPLEGTTDVYYCKVTDVTADRSIKVLGYYTTDQSDTTKGEFHPNEVLVKNTVTKEMMDSIDGIDSEGKTGSKAAEDEIAARPTLTFTAYAVQLWKNNTEEFTAVEAWEKVSGTTENGN